MCMVALPFAVVGGGALKATGLKIICQDTGKQHASVLKA